MALVVDLLSWLLLLAGSFFCVVGGIGLLRLPDFYTRTHAGGMADTLGAGLILTGLMLQGGLSLVTVKLAVILAFLTFSSATTGHALVKAAMSQGLKPLLAEPAEGAAASASGATEDQPSTP